MCVCVHCVCVCVCVCVCMCIVCNLEITHHTHDLMGYWKTRCRATIDSMSPWTFWNPHSTKNLGWTISSTTFLASIIISSLFRLPSVQRWLSLLVSLVEKIDFWFGACTHVLIQVFYTLAYLQFAFTNMHTYGHIQIHKYATHTHTHTRMRAHAHAHTHTIRHTGGGAQLSQNLH